MAFTDIFQVNVAISDGKGGITFCRTSAKECGRFSILGRGSTSTTTLFPQQLAAFHDYGAFVYAGNMVYLFGGQDSGIHGASSQFNGNLHLAKLN